MEEAFDDCLERGGDAFVGEEGLGQYFLDYFAVCLL